MLDHLGLIHMNGRIYLPEIDRFLSADPFVQFPESTQGYNRYSYVGNNPLSYTDPSGFFLKKLLQKIAPVLSVVANFIPGCQLWCSAAIGAATGYLATGSLKGAILGGVSAMAAYGIGESFNTLALNNVANGITGFAEGLTAGQFFGKAALHGLTQGALSTAGGGRFGDGFLGGSSSSLLGPVYKNAGPVGGTVIAATVGGTLAKIGGGKFASGAISAAFVHAFNDLMHPSSEAYHEDANESTEVKTVVYLKHKNIPGGGDNVDPNDYPQHAFVIVEDRVRGVEWIARAGPGGSGGNAVFGSLFAQTTPNVPGSTLDYGAQVNHSQAVLATSVDANAIVAKLQRFTNSVNVAQLSYIPTSLNSNSFAYQAIQVLTGWRPSATTVWAPASQTVLEVD